MIIVKINKKIIIVIAIFIGVILASIALFLYLLTPVSKTYSKTDFTVNKGDSKNEIFTNLKDAKLIRSKYASFIYIILTGKKNIQAGEYQLSRDLSTFEIIDILNKGKVKNLKKDEVKVTLKEGDTLKKFISSIANKTNIDYDDAINTLNDKEFLTMLIEKYDFLSQEILNEDIYYALEGYLYPETYNFYKKTTIKEVIYKVLDVTNQKLATIKEEIAKSKYNIHEILTIASIVEKEAIISSDRSMVSQVIYKRLDSGISLGMDVTSYYGVQKDLKDVITQLDLNDKNPYNTRVTTFIGLPVGPICNPSVESIKAALNPAKTNYLYFVADVTTGKVYFAEDSNEFSQLVEKYVK